MVWLIDPDKGLVQALKVCTNCYKFELSSINIPSNWLCTVIDNNSDFCVDYPSWWCPGGLQCDAGYCQKHFDAI